MWGWDEARRWNIAVSNAYVQFLNNETISESHGGKMAGAHRWAARSMNRKIDHLRTFAKWLAMQPGSPVIGYVMEGIRRFEVAPLEAKRIDERSLLRLEAAAADLVVTEIKRDKARSKWEVRELRKDARPLRDRALFALLLGSGLRIQAVANLNVEQCDFG